MRACLLILFLAATAAAEAPAEGTVPHAPLRPGTVSREVILAGGGATHFACESHDENRRAYHGLYNRMHEFLDGWRFSVGNRVLAPSAGSLELWPWIFQRTYKGGAVESLFMPRRLPGVVISLSGSDGPCTFEPHIDLRYIWDVPRPEYRVSWNERLGALFIERVGFDPPAEVPRVIAIVPSVWADWRDDPAWLPNDYTRDKARRAMERANPWIPGRFHFELLEGERADFAVGLGGGEHEAFHVARELLDRQSELRREARDYFAELATRVPTTSDDRLNKALCWARYSMDQLIMDVRGPGIYAGYHWFTNYWGRDTFISLPGACLVDGDFERAKAILASFAEYQLTDPANPREGRLPNIVNPDNLQYAGVDGTWWWVRALRIYLDYTRDLDFMRAMRPVVDRAIVGAMRHAVDKYGLLTHGDGETWMDAGGEANPRSPRGNRAVEVEALWIDGLNTALIIAELSGDKVLARKYRDLETKAMKSFMRFYMQVNQPGLADHLNYDDTVDEQIRPNQILALFVPRTDFGNRLVVNSGQDGWTIDLCTQTLVSGAGVGSLDPKDPNWLSKHLDWDRGHFDDAYHNGDIWLWLSGPLIQVACDRMSRFNRISFSQLRMFSEDLLESGALGTLREIKDGSGERKQDYGGATSQAWSLAEFIRVIPEALLGFHPQALDRRILWRPALSRHVDRLEVPVFFADQEWRILLERSGKKWKSKWEFIRGKTESQELWKVYRLDIGDAIAEERTLELSKPETLEWNWEN